MKEKKFRRTQLALIFALLGLFQVSGYSQDYNMKLATAKPKDGVLLLGTTLFCDDGTSGIPHHTHEKYKGKWYEYQGSLSEIKNGYTYHYGIQLAGVESDEIYVITKYVTGGYHKRHKDYIPDAEKRSLLEIFKHFNVSLNF